MTQKEINQALLSELYKLADKTIRFYMQIKEGVYTAKEISDGVNKMGEKLKYKVTELVTFDIQVENFKFHADTDNIFMLVDRAERAFHVKQKRKFATSDDAEQENTIDATCVYYKQNGNDLARRQKTLKLLSECVGVRGNELYYKAGKFWYLIHYYYSENNLNNIVGQIKENPDLIKNMLQDMIDKKEYINTLQIELCEVLGLNKQEAINARETCIAERERKKEEAEQARAKQEEERKEKELAEKKERLGKAEKDYLDGKKIASELFEELCEKYGLTLSPKQKGSLRERIVSINRGEYSFYRIKGKQNPKIDGIIKIAYKLYDLIKESCSEQEETNAEVEKFLNGESTSFEKQEEPEQKPETFVSIEWGGRKFDIDFTGHLDEPSQYDETYEELIRDKNNPEFKEIIRSELYERAALYAEKRFSPYLRRLALIILSVGKLLEQLGFETCKADSS